MASIEELYDAAYMAGFRGDDLDRIVAISLAESGGSEGATNSTSAEYSVGPLQINLKAGHAISESDARDPYKAMEYAYLLAYNTPQGFDHWSVHANGSYEQFMPGGAGGSPRALATSTQPGGGGMPDPLGGGEGASGYGSGDIAYGPNGEAWIWNPATGNYDIRAPHLDNPSESPDFDDQIEKDRLEESKRQADLSAATQRRGQDISASVSLRGQSLDFAATQANLAENQRQFNESQAFAKDQFLWQKQNDIALLEQRQQELATQQAQNARMFVLEQENQRFLRDKLAVDTEFGNRNLQLATQNQLFNQQATLASIQLDMTAMTQQAQQLQAQLTQEVNLFNAAKAADVSMFNIDQQTKTAMFNAEGAFNAATFNEQMQFSVDQANVQNERLRQQQLQDLAMSISEAAEDPGDRGRLASLILANSGFGAMDAAIADADLRTQDSLVPLEALLRQREDVQGQDPTPFGFTPVEWQDIQAGQATFTPAKATNVPMPNFSNVSLPKPNTTPFKPVKAPQSKSTPTFDSTKQNFIASGKNTISPNEQFQNWDTAEARAQIPDFVLKDMIARGQIPAMEEGGMVEGAFIAGDSSDGKENEELIIPLGDGMTLILPKKKMKDGSKKATKGVPKFQDGGLFQNEGRSMYEGLLDDTDRTRAQNFLNEAGRRAALGTPFDINRLQTPVFASSPGTSPFVTDLLASLNAIQRGVPQDYFREQANLLRPAGYSEGVIGRSR